MGKGGAKQGGQVADAALSLQDVLDLGGTKEDYQSLSGLNDGDVVISDFGGKSKQLTQSDLAHFMSSELGLQVEKPKKTAKRKDGEVDAEGKTKRKAKKAKRKSKQPAPLLSEHDWVGDDKESPMEEDTGDIENAPESKPARIVIEPSIGQARKSTKRRRTEESIQSKVLIRNTLLIQGTSEWYNLLAEMGLESGVVADGEEASSELVKARLAEAEQLLENEVEMFQTRQEKTKGSDNHWMRKILSSGTQADKLAGHVLLLQESPLHNKRTLDSLMAMAGKKGKREALMTIDTLRELWLETLLPDRKLIPFKKRDLTSEVPKDKKGLLRRDRQLVLWYFEEQLRRQYLEFVNILNGLTNDLQVDIKTKATGNVFALLKDKPEQEQMLLTILVNKIGDKDRKLASKVVHYLSQIIDEHPNMKLVIAKEVERFMYRANVGIKPQYYSVCFLNQMELSHREKDLANHLMIFYFRFFETLVKGNEVESRILSALLTGVNRAFPFATTDEGMIQKQVTVLFKIVHRSTFNCSIQALMLLFQVMNTKKTDVADRFYRALYSKMIDPELRTTSNQGMFLNLMYRAMKTDVVVDRIKSFVKRLLQVCSGMPSQFVCGAMVLISEITRLQPSIKALITQPEEDDEDEHFVDAPDDDSEEEHFVDADSDEDNSSDSSASDENDSDSESSDNETTAVKPTVAKQPQFSTEYDMTKREPMYANAQRSCLWEISQLSRHFHPSVAAFTNTVMSTEPIAYKGDPLQDFTLMRFLDRFSFKNPKKKESDHGGSLMQRKSQSLRRSKLPVNAPGFLKVKAENVSADEKFLYSYFKDKEARSGRRKEVQTDLESAEIPDAPGADVDFAKAFGLEADSDSEFDYDGMDLAEEEDDEGLLDLEAIARQASDSEDDDAGFDADGPFAAAEDFAHLLEEAGEGKKKGEEAQDNWDLGRKKRKGGGAPGARGGRRKSRGGKRPRHK